MGGKIGVPGFELLVETKEFKIVGVHRAGDDFGVVDLRVLEGVGHVDDAGEAEFPGAATAREVMIGHGLDKRNGQAPKRQQIGAHLGMSGVKVFSLDFEQRRAGRGRRGSRQRM